MFSASLKNHDNCLLSIRYYQIIRKVVQEGSGFRKHRHFRDIAQALRLRNSLSVSPSPSEANGGGWGGL